jgi:integrase
MEGGTMKTDNTVATLIERYFTERLMRQRTVSANTIASYRDTFRLLFAFAETRLHKPPSALSLNDLDAPFIGAFVLAIPSKRHDKRQVNFLTRIEIEAILAAPDRTTWLGRDHALLLLAAQTGLRLSELIGLDRGSVHLDAGAHVRCVGKGRKERCTPLTSLARRALQVWLKEPPRRDGRALFPNIHGGRLSADSVLEAL